MNTIGQKHESCNANSRLLVTLDEAGQMLSISSRTVRRMSQEGKLPAILKVGHSSRISNQGIMEYVARLTKQADGC
jgi:excisionase family DNA binding protein